MSLYKECNPPSTASASGSGVVPLAHDSCHDWYHLHSTTLRCTNGPRRCRKQQGVLTLSRALRQIWHPGLADSKLAQRSWHTLQAAALGPTSP